MILNETAEDRLLPPGVWPVLLTPFLEDRSIDWRGLDALVEWFLRAGAAGIFANAQSAEMFQLTNDEKLAIATAVVKQVRERVPVVSGAYRTGTIESQAEFVRQIHDTGVDVVILTACQVAGKNDSDDDWRQRIEQMLVLTGDIRLGLYEMPVPYHRLLTPELMGWAGKSGRFFFHKDTCCNIDRLRPKITAVCGTPLRFYNANTPTLLASLKHGGDGFSGIGANFVPEFYVWLCDHFTRQPEKAAAMQNLLTEFDAAMHRKYPASAKFFLRLRGLEITHG
jgi:4-hydroxy-tetrahydrodipicolinate synthase